MAQRWASPPGRTILTALVGALVATAVGSAIYVAWLSLLFGAVILTAGARDAAATGLVVSGSLVGAVLVEALAVTLCAAVPSVLLARSPAAAPRWWPPLLAGLLASAGFWGLTLAAAGRDGDGLLALFLWPTHWAAWMWVVAAQLVAVNLRARRT